MNHATNGNVVRHNGTALPQNGTALRRNGTAPRKRVLIAGGGVAALETMIALDYLAGERLRIQLMAPERDFVYRPMLVAEPFGRGAARRFSIDALASASCAEYTVDALSHVDPGRHRAMTRSGRELEYDSLVIACGARAQLALPGAVTFWGSGDATTYRELLGEIAAGTVRDVVFSIPAPNAWPLPLYELAMMTAAHAAANGSRVSLTITTPERRALELFGAEASTTVERLLRRHGVKVRCGCLPSEVANRALRLVPGEELAADRVVTLPALEGPFLDDLPYDHDGFIPVDSFGRVEGLADLGVHAAGDVTNFPVKQGGLAAQQADTVAEWIAAEAGAQVEPQRFRPTLRGLLLTGSGASSLGSEPRNGAVQASVTAETPLWWPPDKIAGRYLTGHLAGLSQTELAVPDVDCDRLPVEVELTNSWDLRN